MYEVHVALENGLMTRLGRFHNLETADRAYRRAILDGGKDDPLYKYVAIVHKGKRLQSVVRV